MHWRTIIISKPCKLSLHQRQLHIDGENTVQVPIEDISALVLETPQALITSALLSALSETAVVVMTCDDKHLPNGLLLPYHPHSRQLQVMKRQLSATVPLKKRLWQFIVQQKIRNQALTLDYAQCEGGDYLRSLANAVQSGDSTYQEGIAAQYYFVALFGNGFTRDLPAWHNSALNYGYAVIRACLARSLVAYGFITALGLHHHNELNAFNLVDDFIEPFRPLVDRLIQRHPFIPTNSSNTNASLTPADKIKLVQVLSQDVRIKINDESEKMSVLVAIDRVVESFGMCLQEKSPDFLTLPALIGD